MREAIALARSAPFTSPNPKVGAVVVRDGRVLGRGAHEGAGTPHAERRALEGIAAGGASLYVTLEPCCFAGRTPPCAPAVIAAGVARVVVAMQDPDPRVSGRGFAALRAAGLEVVTGVLEDEARRVNRAYIHHRTTGRPFVVLKLALSLDGRLAAADASSRWMTSPQTRRLVHEQRLLADAVVVGAGTVTIDDPALTVRDVHAFRQPVRVVLDAGGRVRPSAALFGPGGGGPVVVATTDASSHEAQTSWKEAGAEVMVLASSDQGVDLHDLLRELGRRGFLQVYCEGGAGLATSLLKLDLVDRLKLHYGTKLVGGNGISIGDLGTTTMAEAQVWSRIALEERGGDLLVTLERAR